MKVRMHSDCGPQLRSNRTLAHSAVWLPARFGIHITHVYGLECHSKSDLDATMGHIQSLKQQISSSVYIETLDQLVNALADQYAIRARGTTIPHETYVNWMPSVHADDFRTSLLKPKSLPYSIKGCHCWEIFFVDAKQKSMIGKGGEVTGTWCRALILPNTKCTDSRTCHVWVKGDETAADTNKKRGARRRGWGGGGGGQRQCRCAGH